MVSIIASIPYVFDTSRACLLGKVGVSTLVDVFSVVEGVSNVIGVCL